MLTPVEEIMNVSTLRLDMVEPKLVDVGDDRLNPSCPISGNQTVELRIRNHFIRLN